MPSPQVLKSSSPQVLKESLPLRLNHKHIPSHSKYTMRQCKHLQRPLRPCWKPPPCHTPTTKFVPPTRTKPCNPWPVARARAPPQPAETTLDEPSRPAPSAGHDCSDGTYTATGTCHPMRRPRQPGLPHTRRRAHITDKIAISKTRQRQPRTTATTAALQRCGMASHNLSSKVSTAGVDRRCVDRWTHRLQSRRWHMLRQRIEHHKRASHTAETKLCQPARAVSSGVHIATGAINVGTGAPPDTVPPPHGHTRGSPPPPRGTPS